MAKKEDIEEREDTVFIVQLGKNIKKIRLQKKMKQIELAHACDFDRQNMNRIESGKNNVTIKTLRRIARRLGVSVQDIFDF